MQGIQPALIGENCVRHICKPKLEAVAKVVTNRGKIQRSVGLSSFTAWFPWRKTLSQQPLTSLVSLATDYADYRYNRLRIARPIEARALLSTVSSET
jgi:hypothetical protein